MTTDPVRVLVVDDERLARAKILRFLRDVPRPFDVCEAKNGVEALAIIETFSPQIVFLDVEMPGLSGFDVLRQVANIKFQVIFETAYDEFAIKAFEESACDYLLKPFTSERLHKALDRALSRLSSPGTTAVVPKQTYLERLAVRRGREVVVLSEAEIHCFQSEDHYTRVVTTESDCLLELSLTHLEAHLDPTKFKRLHRNAIVRLGSIKSVISGANMTVKLQNGLEIAVSRNHRRLITDMLRPRLLTKIGERLSGL